MSENHPKLTLPDLDTPQKTPQQHRIIAAMAQRAINDAVFMDFMAGMRDDAVTMSVFEPDDRKREMARLRVVFLEEIREVLRQYARYHDEIREEEDRSQIFE